MSEAVICLKKTFAVVLAAVCLCLGSLTAYAADTTLFVDVPATHQLAVFIGDGGAVIRDGTIHTDDYTVEIGHNGAASFLIRADSGYSVEKVLLDGKDVTANLIGGILTVEKVVADGTLAVTFQKAEGTSPPATGDSGIALRLFAGMASSAMLTLLLIMRKKRKATDS